MMHAYNAIGGIEGKVHRLPEARAWFEKSRELAAELKDHNGLATAAKNIASVYQLEGEAAREQRDEPAARLQFQAALRAVEESLRIWQAQKNKPSEATSLHQRAIIHLRLGDLAAAEHDAHEARQIHESLGLKEVAQTYAVLVDIAAARGDTAAAAEWAQKRDAKLDELDRLAGGGGGLSSQMLQALQALTIGCAQVGFGGQPLDPAIEENFAAIDRLPAPLPEFSAALRQLAAGQVPSIPATLPAELQQLLTGIVQAIHGA